MDLHGNSLLKETTPEGEVDQNVFDIQQGVAILIAVREKSVPGYFSTVYKDRSGEKEIAKVLYYDLWGKRKEKYQFLLEASLDTVPWVELRPTAPNYFFAPKNFDFEDEYNQGWSITNIFKEYSTGVETGKDDVLVAFDERNIRSFIEKLADAKLSDQDIAKIFNIPNSSNWNFFQSRSLIKKQGIDNNL
ncbi:MAG: hypothetical protein ACKO5Q_11875, partial [Microcystaceae cyanobacterium]